MVAVILRVVTGNLTNLTNGNKGRWEYVNCRWVGGKKCFVAEDLGGGEEFGWEEELGGGEGLGGGEELGRGGI